MKFQITIKQQAQTVNSKPKCPLYKLSNQKTFDHDRGLETLDQLINNSSIKIFCHDCKKQITLDTITLESTQKQQESMEKHLPKFNNDSIAKKQTHKAIQAQIQKHQKNNQPINPAQYNSDQQDQLFQDSNDDQLQIQSARSSSSQLVQNLQNQDLNIQLTKKQQQNKTDQVVNQNNKNPGQFADLYCVGCFASLQQFPSFYSIRKSLKFAPLNSTWRVYDEVCLLNGLKIWGFGNWGQIKQFMDYNSCLFSLSQIQSHYESLYINGEGPKFPRVEQFDILKAYKPPKIYLQNLMQKYYFPPQNQQERQYNQFLSNILKRQHPVKSFEQQKTHELIKRNSQRQKVSFKMHLQKRPKRFSNGLKESKYPSNSAISHILQEQNQKQSKLHQKQDRQKNESQSQQQSQDNSQQQKINQTYQQIQLKPRSSSKLLDSKMHHFDGKGMKQNLGRSGNILINEGNNLSQNKNDSHPYTSKLKGQNVYSYNPKRKQFQIIQYDYYAQSMLAQLQFSQQDTQQQIELKIKIIQEYNRRLDERIKRRQFVIQHRLLDTEYIIKNMNKYSKYNVQKFEPFRRLLQKNQDYTQIVSSYDKMCKAKSLTQGMIKIKRKLQVNKKNLSFKDVLQYLNKKKQKKQLLGHRLKSDNQKERKVLYKQLVKHNNKKLIVSMSQTSSSYINYSNNSQSQNLYSSGSPINSRTMVNRSQQRQRLRNLNQNVNRENYSSVIHINRQGNQNQNTTNNGRSTTNGHYHSNGYGNSNQNTTGLNSILTQQDINTIQRVAKDNLSSGSQYVNQEFKRVSLKNYTLKSLLQFNPYKN